MLEKELGVALEAAKKAAEAILEIYHTDFDVEIKSDDSPVTLADKTSERIILDELKAVFPDYGYLSEESDDDHSRLSKEWVWIIDPLDGTKDFVARDGEFAINIALAHNGIPVLGVICAPTLNKIYYAIKGQGAYVLENGESRRIHVSNRKKGELMAYCSRSFSCPDAIEFVDGHPNLFNGSPKALGASLKMAFIAEGKGDFFLRLYNGTKEWDVAPGDIIVSEAGGIMVEGGSFKPFAYNRIDVYNRSGYVIANCEEHLFLDEIKGWKFPK